MKNQNTTSKSKGEITAKTGRPWFGLIVIGGVLLATGLPLAVLAYKKSVDDERHANSVAPQGHRKNAPYIPSPQDVVDRMLELGQVDKDDVVYDLGCGDGRIVITAAQRYGCRGVGYEYDAEIAELARENAKQAGVEHLVTIHQRDIFTIDRAELNQATVITLYLLDWMNEKLIPQLDSLDAGKTIVGHDWGLKGITPDHSEEFVSTDPTRDPLHEIHVWTTPLKRD